VQQVGGGNFAGIDGAFHKALPFGQVFAGEEHLAVRLLEQWARAIKSKKGIL
jgi:hypothetical protein